MVDKLRLWASSCSHVGTDLRAADRESLAEAIRQSEGRDSEGAPGFEWDLAVHLGDFSGTQEVPDDEEGREVVRQFEAAREHRREDFYCVAGNHDATPSDQPTQWWFRKWIDPTGENTEYSGVHPAERPFPVEGAWERYSFRVGNLLFLMMSDRNDFPPPVGRGSRGGYPAGAVTPGTFEWWHQRVEDNPDSVIVSAHHHMLKETTVASGPWEGFEEGQEEIRGQGKYTGSYHGHFADGVPEGASYLYFLGDQPDAQAFESYLDAHPGATELWLGGHTHTHPDDTCGGRSHIEQKWGTWFANVAALSLRHGSRNVPMSRLFTFTDGSAEVRVQCYLHTDHYAPRGWYEPAEKTFRLSKKVNLG